MSRLRELSAVTGLSRVTRFITVGALGFGVQIAAFVILTSVGHWPWLPATIVAVELAVVHNFLWHDRWTWRDRSVARQAPSLAGHRRAGSRVTRFIRFNMTTGLTSIAGNAALMAVYVGVMGLPGAAGNVLAVGTMSVVNFMVSDRWVFQTGAEGIEPVERKGEGRKGWLAVSPVASVAAAIVAAMCLAAAPVQAAPAAATVAEWTRYVTEAEARMERERAAVAASMAPGIVDSRVGQRGAHGPRTDAATVAAGSVVSSSIACDGESINVDGGTISRWRGSLVLRGVSLDQLLHRLQVPGTPPPQEDVAASRVLSRTPDSSRVYIRLVRTALVTVTYDTEHEMRFQRWGPALATARSVATRVEEVGGDDHGFLWRLNSYWRYRQIQDGVVVDLESLTLSRTVPVIVRPIAAPIVTRIARESMVRTLEALRRYALN
jgi:putative flippase GtrA